LSRKTFAIVAGPAACLFKLLQTPRRMRNHPQDEIVRRTGRTPFLGHRSNSHSHVSETGAFSHDSAGILESRAFIRILYLERKRAERSGRSFVLMLLESARLLKTERDRGNLPEVLDALAQSTRDTDITGWYKDGSALGVIFTELGSAIDGKS